MSPKRAIAVLLMVLSMATVIHAQSKGTIVFALRMDTVLVDPVTGEWPDMTWIHLLEDAGYDVIKTFPTSLSTAEQATLDTLNNANLVIIGRSMPTVYLGGNNAADKAAWNDIQKPLLTGNMWAMRSTRLNWFNTTTVNGPLGDSSIVFNATIEELDDPVFEGIDVTAPVPWAIGPIDAVGTEDGGNGLVLARMQDAPNNVLFVRFEPYVDFYPGSLDYPAGYRTYIGNGRDASSQPPFNYFPFTEESKKVLLAEVARMVVLGGGPAVGVQGDATTPSTFVLSQNYPNPFNPSTTIRFSLPGYGFTSLKVFNLLGREVATLVNEQKPAGTYQVTFDAAHLPSGVYFYKLRAGSFVETKRMMLVK